MLLWWCEKRDGFVVLGSESHSPAGKPITGDHLYLVPVFNWFPFCDNLWKQIHRWTDNWLLMAAYSTSFGGNFGQLNNLAAITWGWGNRISEDEPWSVGDIWLWPLLTPFSWQILIDQHQPFYWREKRFCSPSPKFQWSKWRRFASLPSLSPFLATLIFPVSNRVYIWLVNIYIWLVNIHIWLVNIYIWLVTIYIWLVNIYMGGGKHL